MSYVDWLKHKLTHGLAGHTADHEAMGLINHSIGIPGTQGFGVGIRKQPLPAGMVEMFGCRDKGSENYGNYQYTDGSIMVWVPAFFYKWGTGANGVALNEVEIKDSTYFTDVAAANAAGFALHRAFYDGGAVQPGFFVDKYLASNNGGVASSIKLGNPLSSNAAHNPFSGLTGAPANNYGGAMAAIKTRGANFFCSSRFIFAALAMLSYAHARASTNTTFCAWWHATNNFPKGCNNNALGDANDSSVLYVADGYGNCGKTGSANALEKTTHNGQRCGVADLNGNMWEITPGLTSNGADYFALNTAVAMKNMTGGNTLATDLFGAVGLAANYTNLGATYGALTNAAAAKFYGSATQVFDAAVNGNAWNAAGLGIPLVGGVGGNNAFGNDVIYDYKPNEMCPISGADWTNGSTAGVWALALSYARGASSATVGCRAALYL